MSKAKGEMQCTRHMCVYMEYSFHPRVLLVPVVLSNIQYENACEQHARF